MLHLEGSKVPESCFLPNTANPVDLAGENVYAEKHEYKSTGEIGLFPEQGRNRIYYAADVGFRACAFDPRPLGFRG